MMNQNGSWREKSRELYFQKYSRKIEKVEYELPDGSVTDFYIKREGPAACVVALTPKNEVILFEQFRPGPNKVLKELPGGYIEKDEDPIAGMQRELLEETGYSGRVQFVTTCSDDAYSTMVRHCYVATDCIKASEPKSDPKETGKMILMPLEKFRNLLRSGEMTDVEVGYLGLDFLHKLA